MNIFDCFKWLNPFYHSHGHIITDHEHIITEIDKTGMSSYGRDIVDIFSSEYNFQHEIIDNIKSEFISVEYKNMLLLKCPKISDIYTLITISSKKWYSLCIRPIPKFFFRLFDENSEELSNNCKIKVLVHKDKDTNNSYTLYNKSPYEYYVLSKGNFIYDNERSIFLYPGDELIFNIIDKNININFDKSIISFEFDYWTKSKSITDQTKNSKNKDIEDNK